MIIETTSQIYGTTKVVSTSFASTNIAAYDEDTHNEIEEFEAGPEGDSDPQCR